MTYEEIVAKVKKAYAKADTALVDEHLAVQVDITGEGEGAFYIEVADGKITVEPFEYYDHDFKVLCTAEEIIAIAEGKKKLSEEVEAGNAYVSRNVDKVAVFDLIVAKKSAGGRKKADAAKAEKKPAKKAAKKDEAVKAEKAEKKPAKKAAKKDEAVKAEKKPAKKAAKKEEAVETAVAAVAETVKEEVKAAKKPGRKPKKEA
jgi:hypothetical protein